MLQPRPSDHYGFTPLGLLLAVLFVSAMMSRLVLDAMRGDILPDSGWTMWLIAVPLIAVSIAVGVKARADTAIYYAAAVLAASQLAAEVAR